MLISKDREPLWCYSMFSRHLTRKNLFLIAVIIIVALNFYTLTVAYPTMQGTLNFGHGDLPRDFSVYYVAGWRMLHNPSQIFNANSLPDGEPQIYPQITPYKYMPSFLVLITPLLTLNYYQAFWVFDAIQFALLPIMALMFYKLLEKKNPAIALLILIAVLLLPYPMPGKGLSVSYFMSWAEGQAKILLSFLLLASFYFGYKGNTKLSALFFALGAFDPRFALLALPLFLFYNKDKLRQALPLMAIVFLALNFMIFYPGVGQGLIGMVFGSGTTTPLYTPAWIPAIMLVALLAVNAKAMVDLIRERSHSIWRRQ
jgi:hypothetical protein